MHFATYVDSLLFAAAETEEAYADPETLEARIRAVVRSIGRQAAAPVGGIMRSALNDMDFMSKDADRVVDACLALQLNVTTTELQTKYGLLNCVRRIQRCGALHSANANVAQAVLNTIGILCFRHPLNQRACDMVAMNAMMHTHAKDRDVVMCGLSSLLDTTSLSHEIDDQYSVVSDQVGEGRMICIWVTIYFSARLKNSLLLLAQDRAAERSRARAILIKGDSHGTALAALRAFPATEDIQTEACEVLSRCMDPSGADAFAGAAVRAATASMKRFHANSGIQLSCANLISSAAMGGVAEPQRVVMILIGSVKEHAGSPDVAHNAFCAIRNIARMSPAGAACVSKCGVFEVAAAHARTCVPAVETIISILESGHGIHEARVWRSHDGHALEDVIGAKAAATIRVVFRAHQAASEKALAALLLSEEAQRVKMETMRRKKAEREAAREAARQRADVMPPPRASISVVEDAPPARAVRPPENPPENRVSENPYRDACVAPRAYSSKLKRELWESVVRYCDEDRCVCETPMCDTCESCAVVRDMVMHARQLFRILEI